MNKLLIEKIKIALKSTRPIDAINDVIREFEEVERLVKWREKILISGKNIKRHRKELDNVVMLMKKYNYPYDISKDNMDTLVKEYFEKIKNRL